jgi:hypothetical protein
MAHPFSFQSESRPLMLAGVGGDKEVKQTRMDRGLNAQGLARIP